MKAEISNNYHSLTLQNVSLHNTAPLEIRGSAIDTAWRGGLVVNTLAYHTEFNKSGGPAGHQVRILWGPAEIYTVPVRMSNTIFL